MLKSGKQHNIWLIGQNTQKQQQQQQQKKKAFNSCDSSSWLREKALFWLCSFFFVIINIFICFFKEWNKTNFVKKYWKWNDCHTMHLFKELSVYPFFLCNCTFLIMFSRLFRKNTYITLCIFWKIEVCSFQNWQHQFKTFKWGQTQTI